LRVVALLEERHGVGVGGESLPLWLEQRLNLAVQALLQARGLDIASLHALLLREPELVVELAHALRIGEARFYRDAPQWEALRRAVIPGLWARRSEPERLLALSAGCSTGEEAWTLGMLLSESAPRVVGATARAGVIGVDRSEPALVTARAATYDAASQQPLPRELAQRFLQPAVDGSVRIVPELQSLVSFESRDLTRGLPPGRYAVIVCKNVLNHCDDEAQERLVHDLLRALTADGLLLVARSEVPVVRSLGAKAHEIAPHVTAFRPQ
jgi:chemotaxis protein methyltransferase CheR